MGKLKKISAFITVWAAEYDRKKKTYTWAILKPAIPRRNFPTVLCKGNR